MLWPDDFAKAVGLARHGNIELIVAGDLQKHAAIRTAFVSLAGRMEEAWTDFGAGCDVFRSRITCRICCSAC